MALRTPKELVQEIRTLSATSLQRIVKLGPKLANSYVRVIERSGNDPAVIEAVKQYLLAAGRAEGHADDATKQLFAAADGILAARLDAMTGADVELLRRELAQRRLAISAPPAQVDVSKVGARAAKVSRGADAGTALLYHGFLDRLRSVAALGASGWTDAQRLLMVGRRKLLATLTGRWEDGWEPTFAYLRDHAVNIAARARELKAAEAALAQVKTSGTPAAIVAAEQAVSEASSRVAGYLSKVKGLLGEAYVPLWRNWKVQMDSWLEVAQREAKALGRGWEAQRVVGNLRIDGSEAWDEAILLVNRETKQVKLFLAAQYKVEKQVSAITQAQNDALRETATGSGKLPQVSFILDGETYRGFALTPMPAGKTSHRYVFNASGGDFSATDIARLRAAGIEVNQLNLDISVPEFDQVARTLIDVVADIVP
jgi:hypothetical protein